MKMPLNGVYYTHECLLPITNYSVFNCTSHVHRIPTNSSKVYGCHKMALVTIREAYRNITKGNTDVCACMNGKFHVCTVNTRENKAICLIMAFKTVHIHSQNTFKPPPPTLKPILFRTFSVGTSRLPPPPTHTSLSAKRFNY